MRLRPSRFRLARAARPVLTVGRGLRPRHGSVLMETVLVMPLLLLLIFGILQFAQIWMARQMTVYAASCAARAMTVVLPEEQLSAAENAARLALAWICHVETAAEEVAPGVEIPGWGRIPGSGAVDRRLRDSNDDRVLVKILQTTDHNGERKNLDGTDDTNPVVGVRVSFRFPLLIPGMAINTAIGNFVNRNQPLAEGADFYGNLARASRNPIVDIDGWPYIDFRETCILPMPYSPANYPRGGFDGCRVSGFE